MSQTPIYDQITATFNDVRISAEYRATVTTLTKILQDLHALKRPNQEIRQLITKYEEAVNNA